MIAAEPVCPRTRLLKSGLTVSRIGVGLAHVHLMTQAQRLALVDTALDLGITHFDTSRFYGDGLSECVLGGALGVRRSQVTIATKFGLLGTPIIGQLGRAAPAGRKLRSAAVRLKLMRHPRRLYTPELMRRSLRASLEALDTDYVDMFLIHEPAGADAISDDLIEALITVRRSGAARLIGVAGDDIAALIVRWGDALDIVQTAEAGWRLARLAPDFTYSLFSSGRGRSAPPLDQAHIDARLSQALTARPNGAVIVQTRDAQRLRRYVEVAAR